ncbi:MAG: carboxylating nicotinate-nucleotide diphosphorylase [Elusimicrobia bacterium]|nr:carboxylating nicotinate-nucleotide diphosphorylase [Elusimicrobiota bacterium]
MNFRREARRALAEDRARRDVTSKGFVPPDARGRARVVVKEAGVLAGGPVALAVFREMHPTVRARSLAPDGSEVSVGQAVLEASGPLRALLSAERSALNFLTHLSGVATLTRRFVQAAGPQGPAILETRKTLPGLRDLEKYAVRMGGGQNHRRDLSDMVLIKENHLEFFKGPSGRADLVRRVRRARGSGGAGKNRSRRLVEMECRNRDEVRWALEAGADLLLLDNIPLRDLPAFVRWVRAEAARHPGAPPLLEVSGGVTLAAIPRLARTGVDRVSVGRLTHSAPALDMSLDVEVQ